MKDYMDDEALAVLIQKNQINKAMNKLNEMQDSIKKTLEIREKNSELLDELLAEAEEKLSTYGLTDISSNERDISFEFDNLDCSDLDIPIIDKIDALDFDIEMDWKEYMQHVNSYAIDNNIDIKKPFDSLMSKDEQIKLMQLIKDDFTYKLAKCDKYDYMIAGVCGVLGGVFDAIFVGTPKDSILGNKVDNMASKMTTKFANFLGYKGDDHKGALRFLEKKFKVNYDQTSGVKDVNLSPKNHHLKSIGHSPDLFGLIYSIINQFNSTSSFIDGGKVITVNTKTHELQGGTFLAKIFCGFCNWIGHTLSDWSGSSGSKGRGAGVPMPFFELFTTMRIRLSPNMDTFNQMCIKIYESGFDTRFAITMAIPVIITNLLITTLHMLKNIFYEGYEILDAIQKRNAELNRMKAIGFGAYCMIDLADGVVRGYGQIYAVLTRLNLIAWVKFGTHALKEINMFIVAGRIDSEKVDKYLYEDYMRMLRDTV